MSNCHEACKMYNNRNMSSQLKKNVMFKILPSAREKNAI